MWAMGSTPTTALGEKRRFGHATAAARDIAVVTSCIILNCGLL